MNARRYRLRRAVLIVTSVMFLLISASTARTDDAVPAAKVLAAEQHESGSEVSLLELKRTSGDTVTAKWEFHNTTSGTQRIQALVTDACYMVDPANKKKYFVVKDSEGNWLAGSAHGMNLLELKPGEKFRMWAKFPAPPLTSEKMTLYIPGMPPLEDVPVSK